MMRRKQYIILGVLCGLLLLMIGAIGWIVKPPHSTEVTQAHTAITFSPKQYDFHLDQDPFGANPTASVDYYMLALSWSPGFCQKQRLLHKGNLPDALKLQCDANYTWVIHGLWPQHEDAEYIRQHPRFCQGDLPPLPVELLQNYLAQSPGYHLLQGEWEKHGACAFKQAKDYFDKQRQLYKSLTLPQHFLAHKELFQWMRQHNPQLAQVRLDASENELFICYDLHWQPINCPQKKAK